MNIDIKRLRVSILDSMDFLLAVNGIYHCLYLCRLLSLYKQTICRTAQPALCIFLYLRCSPAQPCLDTISMLSYHTLLLLLLLVQTSIQYYRQSLFPENLSRSTGESLCRDARRADRSGDLEAGGVSLHLFMVLSILLFHHRSTSRHLLQSSLKIYHHPVRRRRLSDVQSTPPRQCL